MRYQRKVVNHRSGRDYGIPQPHASPLAEGDGLLGYCFSQGQDLGGLEKMLQKLPLYLDKAVIPQGFNVADN